MQLFRREVLEAQRTHLGTIRLSRPLGFSLAAGIAAVMALSLTSFAIWGEVNRKARLPGLLVPSLGSLQLSAPQAGTVVDLPVQEGDEVTAGQVLVVLDVGRGGQNGDTASQIALSLAERRRSLDSERALRELAARHRDETLSARVRNLEADQRQARAEVELAQRRVQLASTTVDRFRQLSRDGFVAESQAQQKQEEFIDLQSRAQAARRTLGAVDRELENLRAESAGNEMQLRTELEQLQRNVAMLEQEMAENETRGRLHVRAPQAGTISASVLRLGQSVQAGQTLLTLVPMDEQKPEAALRAELYAPSRAMGFVRPGQQVWLRFAAFPYQKFGMGEGRILGASRTPILPQDLPAGQSQALLGAAQSHEPLYRVDVELMAQNVMAYGQAQPLKAGMALEADVLQDRRAVWEWVMEPMLAASAKLWRSPAGGAVVESSASR